MITNQDKPQNKCQYKVRWQIWGNKLDWFWSNVLQSPPADIDEVDVGGDHENKIGEGEHHGSGHHGTSATKSEGHHTFVNFFEILFSYFDMKRPPTCPPIRAPIGIKDPTLNWSVCASSQESLRLNKVIKNLNFLDEKDWKSHPTCFRGWQGETSFLTKQNQ